MHESVIVTQHAGLVEFLHRLGIDAPVIPRATVKDIKSKVVYGVLPLRLAAYAECVISAHMPAMTIDQVNDRTDLTCEEMVRAGATLKRYVVTCSTYNPPPAKESNHDLLGRFDADGYEL